MLALPFWYSLIFTTKSEISAIPWHLLNNKCGVYIVLHKQFCNCFLLPLLSWLTCQVYIKREIECLQIVFKFKLLLLLSSIALAIAKSIFWIETSKVFWQSKKTVCVQDLPTLWCIDITADDRCFCLFETKKKYVWDMYVIMQ